MAEAFPFASFKITVQGQICDVNQHRELIVSTQHAKIREKPGRSWKNTDEDNLLHVIEKLLRTILYVRTEI